MVWTVAVSPDSTKVYIITNGAVKEIMVSSGGAAGTMTTLYSAQGGLTPPIGQQGTGIACNAQGTILYYASNSHSIATFSLSSSAATVIAGGGTAGFADATGSAALFDTPKGIGLSLDGLTLYVADSNNQRIRAVTLSTNAVTTHARRLRSVRCFGWRGRGGDIYCATRPGDER